MKRVVPLVGFSMALMISAGGDALAQNRYEIWQEGKPFTIGAMYYDLAFGPNWYDPAPPDYVPDPDMELFRQAGLNLLSDVSMSSGGHKWYPGIRQARRTSDVAYMILAGPWKPFDSFQHRLRWADENCYGVQLGDEPQKPDDQRYHRQQQEWIVKEHPHLLTLFCESLSNIPKWTEEWQAIRSDGITYQWYPYHTSDGDSSDISPQMFGCLQHASDFCKQRGLCFFMTRGTRQVRSASTLRMNTYAALAYGCDGFIDFAWGSTNPEGGYAWYKDQRCQGPGGNFEALAAVNREVANLGPTLLALRHVRTYHLNLLTGVTWAGKVYGFDEPDNLRTGNLKVVKGELYPYRDHLMVGFFRDLDDQEHFMVVNKANSRGREVDQQTLDMQVTLTFHQRVDAIERLNRQTGAVERIELEGHTFTFSLPGGTADLFKYATGKPFAGVR